MSTQLIADAVYNQRTSEEATIWDRLFAVWFQRLVYNQIWEDPDADLAALELPPNATLVTISSAGCNALSYLVANPKQVYAADLNEAHLALLNLKIAGLRGLRNYDMFWRFFGAADSSSNRELYREVMRPLLDVPSRSFWDGRDLTGRQRHRYFCNGFYRHGALAASSDLLTCWLDSTASICRPSSAVTPTIAHGARLSRVSSSCSSPASPAP
jgi:S-adenosylmethionine-diacylglycerol 3-amino-3-carboxypropyl transferase